MYAIIGPSQAYSVRLVAKVHTCVRLIEDAPFALDLVVHEYWTLPPLGSETQWVLGTREFGQAQLQ